MINRDWNDYGAITGPLIVTVVLLLLAFAPVLDSKMWQTMKEISAILTPIAAVTIACFAYRISRRQSQISQRQLKIARFDKRYAVYQAVMNLIADCLAGTVEMKHIYEYRALTKGTQFLFDDAIRAFVESLQNNAIEHIHILDESNKQNATVRPDGMTPEQIESTQNIRKAKAERFSWFEKQYDEANNLFFTHLSIEWTRAKHVARREVANRAAGGRRKHSSCHSTTSMDSRKTLEERKSG